MCKTRHTLLSVIFLIGLILSASGDLYAQKDEKFDIVTFSAPEGWQKEVAKDAVQFGIEDSSGGSCLISMFRSVLANDNSKINFDLAWENIVEKMVTLKSDLERYPTSIENGWIVESGLAQYESDGKKGVVSLVTATGNNKMVNILILTNSESFQQSISDFLESIVLPKIEVKTQNKTANNNALIGNWGKSNAVTQINNRFGPYSYNKQQYTFKADGTYSFLAKNYSEQSSETILIIESGTFLVTVDSLTVKPVKSVIEAWSKKGGGDNWNQLKTSQKRTLEKTTYQYSIEDGNLMLQTTKQTSRDGIFSAGNFYRYGPAGTFTPIKLPGE